MDDSTSVPASDRGRDTLEVRSVSKAFGPTQALDDVSFAVRRGSVHALLGGNGSGKSTLIKILAGVVPADSGEVVVGAARHDLRHMTPATAWANGLRFVHQQRSIFLDMTVAENLRLGSGFDTRGLGPIRWKHVERKAAELIERFDIAAAPDSIVGELSGATQTMVAVARALQDRDDADAGILVLDEPTAALPPHEVDLLLRSVRKYADAGQTILFVTHRLDEVSEIATRATMLRDGAVVATVEGRDVTRDHLTMLMVGNAIERDAGGGIKRKQGSAVLVGTELTGGRTRSVSFSIRRGEIVGVAGLLGSGRSSLLRLLFGMVPIASGRLLLNGKPLRLRSARDAMSAGLALVPEDRPREASFPELSIRENLSMTVVDSYWRRGCLRLRSDRADSRELIDRFHIKARSTEDPLSTLSGGNQQKVILARWLRRQPSVLMLDEPTQGVDVGARSDIYRLIRNAAAGGTGVIVVSSEFEELEMLCDRAVVMNDGVLTCEVSGDDLRQPLLVELSGRDSDATTTASRTAGHA